MILKNSTTIIKAEIAFFRKEFKKLIRIYNDKVDNYLKKSIIFKILKK